MRVHLMYVITTY